MTAAPAQGRAPLRRAPQLTRRLVQLYVGLVLLGTAMGMVIGSGLGNVPWDVLHQGIARHTGLTIGTVSILVACVVLLLWFPLRQRPALGTLSNALLMGPVADLTLAALPDDPTTPARVGLLLGGIVLYGLATALYIGARLGPGARDGLMTGLAARTGRSIRLVRTGLEVVVVVLGWSLGGTVGLGTALFALAIGPLTQAFLRVVAVPLPSAGVPSAAAARAAGQVGTSAPDRARPPQRPAARPRADVTARRRPLARRA